METSANMKLLLVDGLTETTDEDIPKLVVDSLNGILTPSLKLGDIENAWRIGKANSERPRTIILEFVYPATRKRIYQSRMQIARAKKNIYLSEYLTKQNAFLFFKAREATKRSNPERKLEKCWTFNGDIYVNTLQTGRGTLVYNVEELSDMLSKLPTLRNGGNRDEQTME